MKADTTKSVSMERAAKSKKKKTMKFVPGTVSALSFQNPVLSPKRVGHAAKGFSDRKKKKKDETQEPTSPKVSCIGQIKHKNKSGNMPKPSNSKPAIWSPMMVKKQAAAIFKVLGKTGGPKSVDLKIKEVPLDRAPSLGQMKRFASGRDAFANFEWTAQITPVDSEHRDYYSDEERGGSEEEEEEVRIPYSAPIWIGGGGMDVEVLPRMEVNLWERRSMTPPMALRLHKIDTSNS